MRRIEVPEYIRGLIFDCDGTLVDSLPAVVAATNHALRDAGLPEDEPPPAPPDVPAADGVED